jgi:hypothetical protein
MIRKAVTPPDVLGKEVERLRIHEMLNQSSTSICLNRVSIAPLRLPFRF